jgi:acylphosphatase
MARHLGGSTRSLILPITTGMNAKSAIYIPERRRIVIRGKVQGVGFRLWLRNVAQSLNLVGSCRLLDDGTVEAEAQGDRQLVKQFVIACKRGPAEADIEGIEVTPLPVDPRLGVFHVER